MNADGTLSTSRVANAASILAPGKHPALIDQATFDVAQNVRASHDLTRCHASVPVRNPLAGLVYCAVCGKAMVRKDNGNARGSRYDMLKCPTPGCLTTATALSLVEKTILSMLDDFVLTAASSPATPAPDHRVAQLSGAQATIDRLRSSASASTRPTKKACTIPPPLSPAVPKRIGKSAPPKKPSTPCKPLPEPTRRRSDARQPAAHPQRA